jgi:hypothetical protein
MSSWEDREEFYEQFNTIIELHRAWCSTPEGTMEIMRDPWKAETPQVRFMHDPASPASILDMIQQRRKAQLQQAKEMT